MNKMWSQLAIAQIELPNGEVIECAVTLADRIKLIDATTPENRLHNMNREGAVILFRNFEGENVQSNIGGVQ